MPDPAARAPTLRGHRAGDGSPRAQLLGKRVRLGSLALLALLELAIGATPPRRVFEAIFNGKKLSQQGKGVLDVADLTMLDGFDCSAASPCWPHAGGDDQLAVYSDKGTRLASESSRALLQHYGESAKLRHHDYPGLILDPHIYVLFVVDPRSHSFGYVAQRRLVAVPPADASASRIPREHGGSEGDQLPVGVRRKHLVFVWRRAGLLLHMAGVTRMLAEQLGEPTMTPSGPEWRDVDPELRARARAAMAACGESSHVDELLASFDRRVPESR